jgi:N6-adenosine-specific RNA methylase IME4
MSLAEIKAFPQPRMEPDSFLFLWRVSAMVEEAYEVVRAWGFVPKSEIVWLKRTETGKRHFGMGHYVRAEHETCIIATRGSAKVEDRSIRSTFEAPTGDHSSKPDEFYRIVQQLTLGPYVETFARRERRGWVTFGNELAEAAPCP